MGEYPLLVIILIHEKGHSMAKEGGPITREEPPNYEGAIRIYKGGPPNREGGPINPEGRPPNHDGGPPNREGGPIN